MILSGIICSFSSGSGLLVASSTATKKYKCLGVVCHRKKCGSI